MGRVKLCASPLCSLASRNEGIGIPRETSFFSPPSFTPLASMPPRCKQKINKSTSAKYFCFTTPLKEMTTGSKTYLSRHFFSTWLLMEIFKNFPANWVRTIFAQCGKKVLLLALPSSSFVPSEFPFLVPFLLLTKLTARSANADGEMIIVAAQKSWNRTLRGTH